MTEETTSATGWNPLARRDPVTKPLAVSHGEATATFRPWSARERLAYEDRSLGMIGSDEAGNATMRMGRVNALAISLTIDSWTGFPEKVTRPVDDEDVEETFDLRRLEHVELLDPDTYAELAKHARAVQPLPGFDALEDAEEGSQTAALEESGPPDPDVDDGTGEDPSPTPSTAPETAASVDPAPVDEVTPGE